MKSKIIEILVENIKIVLGHLDDVGDDWEFAEYKAKFDELIYKLCKKQEEWSGRK